MTTETPRNWFHQMTGYLSWRIVAPDFASPFALRPSPGVLMKLLRDNEALTKLFEIKCFCDGYEVLHIRNPLSPSVNSEHPSVLSMRVPEIMEYLKEHGVMTQLEERVQKFRETLAGMIEEAEATAEKEAKQSSSASKKITKTPPPSAAGAVDDNRVKVIRRRR